MKKTIEQLKADIKNNKYSKAELRNLIFLVKQILNSEPLTESVDNHEEK